MVAKAHFRKEPRSAIDGGGVRPHTQRVIPGPEPATIPALASTGTAPGGTARRSGCHAVAGLRSVRSRKNGVDTHSYPLPFAAWISRARLSILSAAMPN